MDEVVETIVTPEAAKVEAKPEAKPAIDEANIRKQASYFARTPEAAELFLENYDQMTGGKLTAKVQALELAFVTEQAMRKFSLTDDDRDLIEAPTPEGIFAKAEKLASRQAAAAAKEADGKPKPVEIVYPETKFEPRNPLEAAQHTLSKF